MSEWGQFSVFMAALLALLLIWGRALWYLDEHSDWPRRATFFLLSYTRLQPGELRALLFTTVYCLLGVVSCLLVSFATRTRFGHLFSVSRGQMGLIILGVVGEISLTNLLVDLVSRMVAAGPERFVEIQEIPWIKGLQELPRAFIPFAAALAGMVEELFFRGVLLTALLNRFSLYPVLAIALSGLLFCLQQIIQVRTVFQALVIGSGCAAISLVGGMLVVLTGSVVPAIIGHGSFVIFFMARSGETSAVPVRR